MTIKHALTLTAKWANELIDLDRALLQAEDRIDNLMKTCSDLVKENNELKNAVSAMGNKDNYPAILNLTTGLPGDVKNAVDDVDKYLIDIAKEYRIPYNQIAAMFRKQAETYLVE